MLSGQFFRSLRFKSLSLLTLYAVGLFSLSLSTHGSQADNPGVDALGVARSFNVFVLEDFVGLHSDVQGKLAAGGNIHLDTYWVADKEPSNPSAFHLIAGGNLRFDKGRLQTGSASGTTVNEVADSVINGLEAGALVLPQAPAFSFGEQASALTRLSQKLQGHANTGTADQEYSTLTLKGNCADEAQVFSVDAEVLASVSQIKAECLPEEKTIVVNVTGNTEITWGGLGMAELAPYRHHLLWHFTQKTAALTPVTPLQLKHIGVEGSILAPYADIEANDGVVHGSVFANSWSGTMQVNRYLFSGNFDFLNEAPLAQDETVTIPENTVLVLAFKADDPDGDELSFNVTDITPAIEDLAVNPDGSGIVWQTDFNDAGHYRITFSVSDGQASDTGVIDIHVSNVNLPPVITSPAVSAVDENASYTYQIIADDPDFDAPDVDEKLTFKLLDQPEGMRINADTGVLTWVPASRYTGSVAGVNSQCYIVPPGPVDVSTALENRINFPDVRLFDLRIIRDQGDDQLAVSIENRGLADVTAPITVNFYHQRSGTQRPLLGSMSLNALPAGQSQTLAINLALDGLTNDVVVEAQLDPTVTECDISNNTLRSPVVRATVQDKAGEVDEQVFIVNVLDVNQAPVISGEVNLQLGAGERINLDYDANDGDTGDAVRFALEGAPEGLVIDERTGRITALPNRLEPGTSTFEVVVEDLRGATSRLTVTVTVVANGPPAIVSPALTRIDEDSAYYYDVNAVDPNPGDQLTYTLTSTIPGLDIVAATGEIAGDLGALPVEHALYEDGFCQIEQDDLVTVVGAADIFVSIDESGSMSGEQDWLRSDAIPFLEAELKKRGVGAQADNPNLYGLTGFGKSSELVRALSINDVYQMGIEDFKLAAANLVASGGTEDGYAGIKLFFEAPYQFRPERARNVLLITDEDRDVVDSTATKAFLLEAFAENNVILNVVVEADFQCGDGRKALGLDAAGQGYVVEANGDYSICDNATVVRAAGSTQSDYIDLMVATGGAAWDLEILRQGGDVAQSFSKAFTEIKIKEIIRQLPPLPLPELLAFNLRYDHASQQLQVDVRNQGLADARQAITVDFFLGDEKVGSAALPGLAKSQQQTVVLDGITIDPEQVALVQARLSPGDNKECLEINNSTSAAIVGVRVVDEGGLADTQVYALSRSDSNQAPRFVSPATTSVEAGTALVINSKAMDPDSGDLLQYRLIDAPDGVSIKPLTGEVAVPALAVGIYVISMEAIDGAGNSIRQDHLLTVMPPDNLPPVFESTPNNTAALGQSYRYQAIASDPEGGMITWLLNQGPQGMSMNELGQITWLPGSGQAGVHAVSIAAFDPEGAIAYQEFAINAVDPAAFNRPPRIITVPENDPVIGQRYRYRVIADDPDNDPLTYQLRDATAGMTLDAEGDFYWLPDVALTGQTVTVTIVVRDDRGGEDQQQLVFAFTAPDNTPPQWTNTFATQVDLGQVYLQALTLEDAEGDGFSLELLAAPRGMQLVDQQLQWTPGSNQAEQFHEVVLLARDDRGAEAQVSYRIWVSTNASNLPPQLLNRPDSVAPVGLLYSFQPDILDPEGEAVALELVSGPETMTFVDGQIQWQPAQSDIGTATVVIAANDGVNTVEFTFSLTVLDYLAQPNRAPLITSQPSGFIFAGQAFRYQVVAEDADGDPLSFSLQNPAPAMTISPAGLLDWLPAEDTVGDNYRVTVRVRDGRGAEAKQTLSLTVGEGINTPPRLINEPLNTATAGQMYRFTPHVVDADDDPWTLSLKSAPNGMTLDTSGDAASLDWLPATQQAGKDFAVHFGITDARGAHVDIRYTVTVTAPSVPNTAPLITSQPGLSATVDALYTYGMVAVDAEGDALSYTLMTGPDDATLDQSGLLSWTPLASEAGLQAFTVAVSDGNSRALQSFSVNVVQATPDNQHPDITSIPVVVAVADTDYRYPVVASDPEGQPLTYRLPVAPPGMAIDEVSGLVSWTPSMDQRGSHEVQVMVGDGELFTLQAYTVEVFATALPLDVSVFLEPDTVLPGEDSVLTVFVEGGEGEVVTTVTIDGQPVLLDQNGQTVLSWPEPGVYPIKVQVSDDNETLHFDDSLVVRDSSDVTQPLIVIEDLPGAAITAPMDIVGSINDERLAYYRVVVRPVDNTYQEEIFRSDTAVIDDVLFTLDPTRMENGQYRVIVEAVDLGGNSTTATLPVQIDGNMKLGEFTVTFTDMEIPLKGLPVRVSRRYSSFKRAQSLDFGYGWTIDYQDIKVEESRQLGKDWIVNEYPSGPLGLIPLKCVEPAGEPTVTITLPDGDVERFTAEVSPRCNPLYTVRQLELTFKGDERTQSTLEALDDSSVYFANGDLNKDLTDARPADPGRYKLTTRRGYVYFLNQAQGIEKVVDPDGNTLTYTNDGIFHSSGEAVRFQRNSEGRITAIEDPAGHQITYDYSLTGDLLQVNYTDTQSASYGYNNSHYLTAMEDGLGRTIAKNLYEDGRLVRQEQTLADGSIVSQSFAHDPDNRVSIITDRRNHVTQHFYNARGNIVKTIDARQATWRYDFNDQDQKTLEVNPEGTVTRYHYADNGYDVTRIEKGYYLDDDPEQFTLVEATRYETNQRGQETVIIDGVGNRHDMTYDTVGNLISIKNPDGDIAGNYINRDGLIDKTVDIEGNTTYFTYDDKGNRLSRYQAETASCGRWQYDANNNVLTAIRFFSALTKAACEQAQWPADARRAVTRYEYDRLNRVVKTVQPDGSEITTTYNRNGEKVSESQWVEVSAGVVEEQVTRYAYDLYGRTTQITYPDTTVRLYRYDGEGNRRFETDRLGRTTEYQYDPLNRVVKTLYPDGKNTQMDYDGAGRLSWQQDEEGHRTYFQYDEVGRQTAVLDHNEVVLRRSVYNADGTLKSEQDGNNRSTHYRYNSLAQRVNTILPSGAVIEAVYDSLDRQTERQEARWENDDPLITRLEYDAEGRLTRVLDALKQSTVFTYDAAGNKISQRDGEGRLTQWAYDEQGRLSSRTLPEGQQERFTYNAAGNPLTHHDFTATACAGLTGHTCPPGGSADATRYGYDSNNRLDTVHYADGTMEDFDYDPVGRLEKVRDIHNRTTEYAYDKRDRLSNVSLPTDAAIDYTYHDDGQLHSATYTINGEQRSLFWAYDERNRLVTVTENDTEGGTEGDTESDKVTTYEYDNGNNLKRVHYPNGVSAHHTYNGNNQLRCIQVTGSSGDTVLGIHYTLLANGRREQESVWEYDSGFTCLESPDGNGDYYQSEQAADRVKDYRYDASFRLVGETITTTDAVVHEAEYRYDKVGNRTYSILNGVHTVLDYDGNDRLLSLGGSDYRYDPNGNRISETLDGVVTEYVYNEKNQLARVRKDNTTIDYRYMHDGIRDTQIVDGITKAFIIDPNRDFAQVVAEVNNGVVGTTYSYGLDLIQQTSGESTHYLHTDGLGSTRLMTDEDGQVSSRYDYEAFGELLDKTTTPQTNYLFTGEQFDSNLGQYYLRARYYDQSVGGFTQMDTYQGRHSEPLTLHKYFYANVDPVNFVDPTGNFGLASIGVSLNVRGVLSTAATTGGRSAIQRVLLGRAERGSIGIVGNQITLFAREALYDVLTDAALSKASKAVKGTKAHTIFERKIRNFSRGFNKRWAKYGVSIKAEVFFDDGGDRVPRRQKGSLGIDVVVFYNLRPLFALDLKTGKDWSKSELKKRSARFGNIPIVQILVGPTQKKR